MKLIRYAPILLGVICSVVSMQSFATSEDIACVYRNSDSTGNGERAERVLVVMDYNNATSCIDGRWYLKGKDFLSIAYINHKTKGKTMNLIGFQDHERGLAYHGFDITSIVIDTTDYFNVEIGGTDGLYVKSYEADNSVIFKYHEDDIIRKYRFYKKMSIPEAKALRAEQFLR